MILKWIFLSPVLYSTLTLSILMAIIQVDLG